MNESGHVWQRFDYILLGAVTLLILFGIMMIASATLDAVDPDLINRLPDQMRFAVVGMAAMLALALMDYRLLSGFSTWLYLGMIILLLMVIFLGVEGDAGAQRWLNIGIRIQPSEIGKIVIIITLSNFLATRYKDLDKFSTVIASFIHLAIPAGLVFIQPNLGTTLVFIVIWATIMWGAGLRVKHILLMVGFVVLMMPIAFTQLKPYQLSRITTFLCSECDPEAQYNIDQAKISIGSGGLLGKGYAAGSQNVGRFLRVRHTDFIFSVIAHEFGMVGALAVMALLGVVLMRILHAARKASDALGSMLCYGVAGMIFFQTVVSIGMNINIMPVTGLVLPFVSSGGTSLLFTMIGIGLVQSVVIRQRRFK
jgi:rod shape determining protein RodA